MLNKINYNPDILSCLANLSSDEVFTPPDIVNNILDLLPQDLFLNENIKFLDPGTKTGVFLREIAKRLNKGLEKKFPDQQKRLNHIFTNQLFGIAITQLTSLLSRRSVYCSKTANSKYSIVENFNDDKGNIIYEKVAHTWDGIKCKFCGASRENYLRSEDLETHAYQFIHTEKPEELFNMKFDVIIGNPPYQLDTGGAGRQAKPIYQKFVEQAIKLNPTHVCMITPSRWFAGGIGLDDFREKMLKDRHLSHIVDYTNAKDCFPGQSIGGGVNYFLWSKNYTGECEFTTIHNGEKHTLRRNIDEHPVLVRYNQGVEIIRKVQALNEQNMVSLVSSINPFGFQRAETGSQNNFSGSIKLHSSKGVGYVKKDDVLQGRSLIDKYKVIVSQAISEHAGEPNKDGSYKLLSTVKLLEPGEICTFSYITIGAFDDVKEAENLEDYLITKFSRFLILLAISSINISKDKFMFLPTQDFTKKWTDEDLYKKYKISQNEIDFIENIIKDWTKK